MISANWYCLDVRRKRSGAKQVKIKLPVSSQIMSRTFFFVCFYREEIREDQGTNIYPFTMKDNMLAHLPQCSVPGDRGSGLADLTTWPTFSFSPFFSLSHTNLHQQLQAAIGA